jgi:signal transduction histidine kinase
MPSTTRHLSLALVLLLVFLAAALTAQRWLQHETRRLQAEAVNAKRAEAVAVLALAPQEPAAWDEAYLRQLGSALGATVRFGRADGPRSAEAGEMASLRFDLPLPGPPPAVARVSFAAPALTRLVMLQERMPIALGLLGVALLMTAVLLAASRRPAGESGPLPAADAAHAEMRDLEHLARVSVERGEALERESGARHRAEEDLQLSRTLLDQSLEERVRLGRDLHDNICQTLYAVSLTLEGVRQKVAGGGTGEAGPRLDQCIAELRRLNREVRTYLRELEPAVVHRPPFMEALDAMLAAQPWADNVRLVRNLDPEVTPLIPPGCVADAVNVLREAVSNSLRHAAGRTITVHAWRGEGSVVLAVQDDGAGFDPAVAAARGHGLANMAARAAALGGHLNVVSTPGKGTRVLLTLPVSSAP